MFSSGSNFSIGSYGANWDSDELLQALFQALPLGICITDATGKLVYVNEAYSRIYGYSIDELLGQSFLIVVPEKDRTSLQRLHDDFIYENKDEIPSYWELIRKDGRLINVSATAARFHDKQCNTYKVTTILDVTDKVRLEKMREDAERIIHHDLKNPLNGILGSAQLLLELCELPHKEREYCTYIYDSGRRMHNLLEHSMDLFRLEEGSYTLSLQECDLAAIFRDLTTEFRYLAERLNVGCELRLDDRALDENDKVVIWAEKPLLVTMLSNLVKNAMEATSIGGIVRLELFRQDEDVNLQIINDGVVSEEIRDFFFDRYVTCNKEGGTGLGTWSALLIAKAHGGMITMDTSDDTGTTISVRLPRNIENT